MIAHAVEWLRDVTVTDVVTEFDEVPGSTFMPPTIAAGGAAMFRRATKGQPIV
jgi:hypothetical protein